MPATISKTFRLPAELHRRLAARAAATGQPYAQAHREALARGLAGEAGGRCRDLVVKDRTGPKSFALPRGLGA
jgi:plasmid stability protein